MLLSPDRSWARTPVGRSDSLHMFEAALYFGLTTDTDRILPIHSSCYKAHAGTASLQESAVATRNPHEIVVEVQIYSQTMVLFHIL